ncbi:aldo/keto reductase [Pigmentibacter sp. JX0631]|nr:aldo/keto reductase [Pigmentibacter sp. JX0631]WGL59794.1 aldo/keto reductase [Pigmentibacter sp. JX0631]
MEKIIQNTPTYKIALELAKKFEEETKNCLGIQLNQKTSECEGFWPLLGHTINNLGDPFTGLGGHLVSFEAEKELIYFVSNLLKLPENDVWGYTNPGSSFSNLHGIHIGMRRFLDPILVFADDAHYSILKAALITRCKQILKVKTEPNGSMSAEDLFSKLKKQKKNENYIFIFCSGSVAKGAYDNILELINCINLANIKSENYHIHLDAALGGLITPFLENQPLSLDFRIEEIDTLSVSLHKRVGIPMPGSLFLARKKVISNLPCSPFAECVASYDTTIGGSRDGTVPIIALNIIKKVGVEGFKKRTQTILERTKILTEILNSKNIEAWHNKFSPCVVLPAPSQILAKKYHLPIFVDQNSNNSQGNFTHIFTMEHVTEEVIYRFVDDYIKDPLINRKYFKIKEDNSEISSKYQKIPAKEIVKKTFVPMIGLGTYRIPPGIRTYNAVLNALKLGYRHIDTASVYENEEDIGKAIKDSNIPREELFISTKLASSKVDPKFVKTEFSNSLKKLGLEYIDLYMIHSPKNVENRLAAWKEIEKISELGHIKAIGVSNYGISHLEELLKICSIKPAINQL